jgi:hypothetical protein
VFLAAFKTLDLALLHVGLTPALKSVQLESNLAFQHAILISLVNLHVLLSLLTVARDAFWLRTPLLRHGRSKEGLKNTSRATPRTNTNTYLIIGSER